MHACMQTSLCLQQGEGGRREWCIGHGHADVRACHRHIGDDGRRMDQMRQMRRLTYEDKQNTDQR
jgi:hypothetical protein